MTTKGNPRLGKCLCGAEGTIRDTKAEDGRLHFTCRELTPEGRAKHFGFVDRSEAGLIGDTSIATESIGARDEGSEIGNAETGNQDWYSLLFPEESGGESDS